MVKAPEAGYPPYNAELLPEGDGTRSTLRITLAVAGFSEVTGLMTDGDVIEYREGTDIPLTAAASFSKSLSSL